jgi:hypothetical protein
MPPQYKHLFLIILPLFCTSLTAQIGYQLISGARSLGMGGSSVTLQDEHAVFHNPAGLMGLTQTHFLLASEIRFGLKDLKPIGCAFVLPTSSGVLGATFQNFTFSPYRDSKLGLVYARRLFSKFNVGIRLDYEHLKFEDYGSINLLNFGIGCNTWILKDLVVSAFIFNPIAMKINESERAPSVFQLGFAYTVNPKVLVSFETEKDIVLPASFKFGFAYQAVETLNLRCGFRTSPASFSFGIGYKLNKNFTVDCALMNQATLGATPALSVSYHLGKNKTVATD